MGGCEERGGGRWEIGGPSPVRRRSVVGPSAAVDVDPHRAYLFAGVLQLENLVEQLLPLFRARLEHSNDLDSAVAYLVSVRSPLLFYGLFDGWTVCVPGEAERLRVFTRF